MNRVPPFLEIALMYPPESPKYKSVDPTVIPEEMDKPASLKLHMDAPVVDENLYTYEFRQPASRLPSAGMEIAEMTL